MATEKKLLKAYADEEVASKIKNIAKQENRSVSQEITFIIQKYIEEYGNPKKE